MALAGRTLGAQRHDELGAEAGLGADVEGALDRGASGADVPQALAGAGPAVVLEAAAVVAHRDDPLAVAPADDDLSPPRARVLAHVREPLLDDPEHLDLLVGRERDPVVDLELDLELAVGGQELDVAPKSRVEGRRAARRRQRQDREARLLLRRGGRLPEPGNDLLRRRAVLEHARVRRDGEEVLREPVVDLARDARPLLADRATELRR